MNAHARAARAPQRALLERIAELEDRLRTLERQVAAGIARPTRRAVAERGPPVPSASRCPGCLLELPPGPRGSECVWCGFVFSATRSRKSKGMRPRRRGGMQGGRANQEDTVSRP